tara:strand:+ start:751 stop:1416 length:666 start_codon:yes stop_codon:yes gene_type:complete
MDEFDVQLELKMNHMQRLTNKCRSLTHSQLVELLKLRFDTDDLTNINQFMLRVHPDKSEAPPTNEMFQHWLNAVRCSKKALQATPHGLQEALDNLAEALDPLYNVYTPKPNRKDVADYDTDDNKYDEETTVMMPTPCSFCNKRAPVCRVLSATKYSRKKEAKRLWQHKWQHAKCTKKNKMHFVSVRFGWKALENTTRCEERMCFIDDQTGAEIRYDRFFNI